MPWILLLTIGLIVFNLYGLYMRYLILNLVGTIAILCVLYILLQVEGKNTGYWYKLFRAGTYLILLGLAFEAYEGESGKILLRTVITSLHRDLPLWR